MLKKGARWRVGNGKDISIRGATWLPSISEPKASNPMGIDFPEVKVSSLINPLTRSWDVDLLQALFKPEEAQLIRGIPLGNALASDRVIWPHTQSGVYTVKSGYYLLCQTRNSLNDDTDNPTPPRKLWKLIWSMTVPSKVWNFLWRAVNNAIPVMTSLVKRQVLSKATCEQCKLQPESVLHALWSCPCLNEVLEFD